MPRPIHFDIVADDPERKSDEVLQERVRMRFDKWDGPMDYWMATTGSDSEPGINGGISRGDPKMGMPNINTIRVNSARQFSKKVQDGGGKVVMPRPQYRHRVVCHVSGHRG